MIESTAIVDPAASLARIAALFRALSESRSELQSFTSDFLSDLGSLRDQLYEAEDEWSEAAASGAPVDDDEIERLLVRLAEAEAALERPEQELLERQAAAQSNIAQIDDDTRKLIDDLITERDALQQDLIAIRRSKK